MFLSVGVCLRVRTGHYRPHLPLTLRNWAGSTAQRPSWTTLRGPPTLPFGDPWGTLAFPFRVGHGAICNSPWCLKRIFHSKGHAGTQHPRLLASIFSRIIAFPVGLSLVWWYLVTKSCPTLCNPMDCSIPGFPVLHCLLEFAETHVHWVSDAISLSHPLSLPSPPALSLFPESGSFPVSWLFTSGGQSIISGVGLSNCPWMSPKLQSTYLVSVE